tara:strand:- start:548 stop:715 length:168 start_codon:yes stop_codon:yes gene_type:complete
MIQEELKRLEDIQNSKLRDVQWAKESLAKLELELEMVENRIKLTKQVMAEESEVK